MIDRFRRILRTQPEESDLLLCFGVESLFFGTAQIYLPAGIILVGVIFTALAFVAAR